MKRPLLWLEVMLLLRGGLAWGACACRRDADRSFPAAPLVKGMREAFLGVKESRLLKPQD